MDRRSFDGPRFRMHGSSPYGPSPTPFSPGSPRFLNPWPHSPTFRQQYIPHCSSSYGQPVSQSTPNSGQNDTRWQRGYPKKPKRGYYGRDESIEQYVKDSMLEDPWLHLEKSANREKSADQLNVQHSMESNHQQLSEISHLDGSACQQEKAETTRGTQDD